jgi:6-phosphogluconolactonase
MTIKTEVSGCIKFSQARILFLSTLLLIFNYEVMQLHIYKNTDELSKALADWIVSYISETLKNKDAFTMVLSGGSTPKKLHEVLASTPYREQIDWEKLHFFWGDERVVPFEDDRNNAKMAYETLLSLVPVNPRHIHPMNTEIEPQLAADEYEKLLDQYFNNKTESFDLVLLGMGDDGHTLSLFPGSEIMTESKAPVKFFYLKAQSMYRITLSAPIVNKAKAIVFLATGNNKAHTLKQVIKGEFNPQLYPSQLIKPVHGSLHWYIDELAASELK